MRSTFTKLWSESMTNIFMKIKEKSKKKKLKNFEGLLHVLILFIEIESILSLYDLIMSTLISKHSDLVIYSIIALGYILKLVE